MTILASAAGAASFVAGRMVSCWLVRECLSLSGGTGSDTGMGPGSISGAMRRSVVMGGRRAGYGPREDGYIGLGGLAAQEQLRTPGAVPRSVAEESLWRGELRRLAGFVSFNLMLVYAVLAPSWTQARLWAAWFTLFGAMRAMAALGPPALERVCGLSPDLRGKLARRGVRCFTLLLAVLALNMNLYRWGVCLVEARLLALAAGDATTAAALEWLFRVHALNMLVETLEKVARFLLQHPLVSIDQRRESRGSYAFYLGNMTSHVHLTAQLAHAGCLWALKGFSWDLVDLVLAFSLHENLHALRKCHDTLRMFEFHRAALLQLCDEVDAAELLATNGYASEPDASGTEDGGSAGPVKAEPDACSICWDALDVHVVRLPCRHCFHRGCAIHWLERCRARHAQPSCPLCRAHCT